MLTQGCNAQPRNREASHTIEIHYADSPNDLGVCSATAIGKQAILTAKHCFNDGWTGLKINDTLVKVHKVLDDNNDHLIILISGMKFNKVASVKPNALSITDSVYLWGNPKEQGLHYRTGVVSDIWIDPETLCVRKCYALQLPTAAGDSGGGLFKGNHLVGVVSGTMVFTNNRTAFFPTFITALQFTEEQYKEALKWKTKN